MRIIRRAAFLALPAGTVFAKYEPHFFGPLSIKAQTDGADFYVQDLIPEFVGNEDPDDWTETLDAIESGETSPPLDYDLIGLDDLRDAEQLFAVFDPDDVAGLIERLRGALADSAKIPDRR